jgi:hypothetical protein
LGKCLEENEHAPGAYFYVWAHKRDWKFIGFWGVFLEPAMHIGDRDFVDGIRRPVYLDDDGRQYVYDDGQRVYGVWLPPVMEPADEPIILGGKDDGD